MPDPLRVVIDARPLSQNAGGFRSYVRALLMGLRDLPGGDGILLYVDRPLPPECATILPPCAQVRVLHPSRLRTDFDHFARQVKIDAPDLVHGTVNYLPVGLPRRICQTVAIHDAFGIKTYPWDEPLHKWTPRHRALNRYWAWQTRASARRADHIITVSNYSKSEILTAVPGLREERISVIPNGLTLTPPADNTQNPSRVLVMGESDGRKNLTVVARALGSQGKSAWANYPTPSLDVVCGSDKTARRSSDLLHRHGVSFCLLPCLDDAGLADAFAGAGAFVWASRGEGFGLPPLEALWCGCLVVASSAPAMPEILGNAPLYFDPADYGDLAAKLQAALIHSAENQARRDEGRQHAQAFTPERMARAHVKVWHEAAGKR